MNIGDWVRDDLPDMLWPALLLSHEGDNDAFVRFARWQRDVLTEVSQPDEPVKERSFVADCLSGRLIGLDRLVERFPEAKAIVLQKHTTAVSCLSPC